MNYFEENEKNDLQKLYEWNCNTKIFDSITPAKEKSQIDAIGKHKTREFAIELKRRFVPLSKYKTMFIEDYKLASMMLEYTVNNREPLYICFLNDAIAIFNLLKLKKIPQIRITDIKSEGYGKMQCQERRYLLDFEDAAIYVDNNLVKPMGIQWKTQQYS